MFLVTVTMGNWDKEITNPGKRRMGDIYFT